MIHPLRPYPGKFAAFREYSKVLDFWKRDAERWYLPRVEINPKCTAHGRDMCMETICQEEAARMAYSDDSIKLEHDNYAIGIVPTDSDGGYYAVVRHRLLHSQRHFFQTNELVDAGYISVFKVINVGKFQDMEHMVQILRGSDGQCRHKEPQILLDDSSLGTLEGASLKELAVRSGGHFLPLSIALAKQYKRIEAGSKEIVQMGQSKILSDLRKVWKDERITIPAGLAKDNQEVAHLFNMLDKGIDRSNVGEIRFSDRSRATYDVMKYAPVFALGMGVTRCEIMGWRMLGCRVV